MEQESFFELLDSIKEDAVIEIKGTERKIPLSVKQIRVICECLNDFKSNIDKMEADDVYHMQRRKLKSEEVEQLFDIFTKNSYWKSSFDKVLEKCKVKKKQDDIGEDALTLSTNGYKN